MLRVVAHENYTRGHFVPSLYGLGRGCQARLYNYFQNKKSFPFQTRLIVFVLLPHCCDVSMTDRVIVTALAQGP